jgi:selenide,water dikinase
VREDGGVTIVPLTSLSHGAGCGCKLPAAAVLPIVRDLPAGDDPRLLVGSATGDDAAVFRLADDVALVQTIDFFTPLVDDPYDFGRIAAANALSDVYAMGGRPLTAMNVVAFPLDRLGGDVLREILRGGLDVVGEAGASLVGGHSIDDPEPKYGLAVTGVVDPARMLTNAGGRAGDALVLTKPLGGGAIVTARKRGAADDELLARAVAVMAALNADASAAAVAAGASAMTDVTGFGLLGHGLEMARASGTRLAFDASALPILPGALELARAGVETSGGAHNRRFVSNELSLGADLPAELVTVAHDPQTSGGLLAAVARDRVDAVRDGLAAAGVEVWMVGVVEAGAGVALLHR